MTIDQNALALQLQGLVTTLDSFVNGGVSDVVAISSGRTIGTLAGLNNKITSIKYVQKIIDYQTLALAQTDAAAAVLLGPGNLVRVYGETNVSLNKLYQVQPDLTLRQIDYVDIYDLSIPPEYDKRVIQQNLTQLSNPLVNSLITYNVQPSTTVGFSQFLQGSIKVVSHVSGKEGLLFSRFNITIWLKGTTFQYKVNYYAQNNMPVTGSTLDTVNLPQIIASVDTTNTNNYIISLKPTWATSFSPSDLVSVEYTLEDIDRNSFY